MDRTRKLLFVPIFAVLLCFFLFVGRYRFIGADEGFYALASRLVLEHKVPYLDFFYQQSPLLPYVYGLWMKLFGISWFSARSLSATLTAILGLLIYEHVCHETRKWVAGLAAVILYASSTFIFAWFPMVKIWPLAALFLFGACVIVARLSPASSPWLVALAGLLLGLSVDTRSYIVVCAPLLLWWIFRHSETHNRIAVLGNRTWMNFDIRDVCDNPREVCDCERILLSNDYKVVRTIGDASIFVCCSSP